MKPIISGGASVSPWLLLVVLICIAQYGYSQAAASKNGEDASTGPNGIHIELKPGNHDTGAVDYRKITPKEGAVQNANNLQYVTVKVTELVTHHFHNKTPDIFYTDAASLEDFLRRTGLNRTTMAQRFPSQSNRQKRQNVQTGVISSPRLRVLADRIERIGDDVALFCKAEGNPPPTLSWFREGDTTPYVAGLQPTNDRIEVRQPTTDVLTLHITNLIATDSGNYTCVGTNIAGQMKMTRALHISYRPKFTYMAQQTFYIKMAAGAIGMINCTATGFPTPTYKFYRAGEALNYNSTYSFRAVDQSAVLTVHLRSAEDKWILGAYRCQAANAHGSDYIDLRLIVGSIPSAAGSAMITAASARWVKIAVVGPTTQKQGEVAGYTVFWMKKIKAIKAGIDMNMVAQNSKLIANLPIDGSKTFPVIGVRKEKQDSPSDVPVPYWEYGGTFKVDDLEPETDYYILVSATNPVGISNPVFTTTKTAAHGAGVIVTGAGVGGGVGAGGDGAGAGGAGAGGVGLVTAGSGGVGAWFWFWVFFIILLIFLIFVGIILCLWCCGFLGAAPLICSPCCLAMCPCCVDLCDAMCPCCPLSACCVCCGRTASGAQYSEVAGKKRGVCICCPTADMVAASSEKEKAKLLNLQSNVSKSKKNKSGFILKDHRQLEQNNSGIREHYGYAQEDGIARAESVAVQGTTNARYSHKPARGEFISDDEVALLNTRMDNATYRKTVDRQHSGERRHKNIIENHTTRTDVHHQDTVLRDVVHKDVVHHHHHGPQVIDRHRSQREEIFIEHDDAPVKQEHDYRTVEKHYYVDHGAPAETASEDVIGIVRKGRSMDLLDAGEGQVHRGTMVFTDSPIVDRKRRSSVEIITEYKAGESHADKRDAKIQIYALDTDTSDSGEFGTPTVVREVRTVRRHRGHRRSASAEDLLSASIPRNAKLRAVYDMGDPTATDGIIEYATVHKKHVRRSPSPDILFVEEGEPAVRTSRQRSASPSEGQKVETVVVKRSGKRSKSREILDDSVFAPVHQIDANATATRVVHRSSSRPRTPTTSYPSSHYKAYEIDIDQEPARYVIDDRKARTLSLGRGLDPPAAEKTYRTTLRTQLSNADKSPTRKYVSSEQLHISRNLEPIEITDDPNTDRVVHEIWHDKKPRHHRSQTRLIETTTTERGRSRTPSSQREEITYVTSPRVKEIRREEKPVYLVADSRQSEVVVDAPMYVVSDTSTRQEIARPSTPTTTNRPLYVVESRQDERSRTATPTVVREREVRSHTIEPAPKMVERRTTTTSTSTDRRSVEVDHRDQQMRSHARDHRYRSNQSGSVPILYVSSVDGDDVRDYDDDDDDIPSSSAADSTSRHVQDNQLKLPKDNRTSLYVSSESLDKLTRQSPIPKIITPQDNRTQRYYSEDSQHSSMPDQRQSTAYVESREERRYVQAPPSGAATEQRVGEMFNRARQEEQRRKPEDYQTDATQTYRNTKRAPIADIEDEYADEDFLGYNEKMYEPLTNGNSPHSQGRVNDPPSSKQKSQYNSEYQRLPSPISTTTVQSTTASASTANVTKTASKQSLKVSRDNRRSLHISSDSLDKEQEEMTKKVEQRLVATDPETFDMYEEEQHEEWQIQNTEIQPVTYTKTYSYETTEGNAQSNQMMSGGTNQMITGGQMQGGGGQMMSGGGGTVQMIPGGGGGGQMMSDGGGSTSYSYESSNQQYGDANMKGVVGGQALMQGGGGSGGMEMQSGGTMMQSGGGGGSMQGGGMAMQQGGGRMQSGSSRQYSSSSQYSSGGGGGQGQSSVASGGAWSRRY
ncbi:uncharacterized protein LOC141910644 isoform X3 [Tubulanus polymorphus]|uniref:uncharacterized protein LOC141910644 isoform X3 n=1 Tax=Tubulanus polymorphus TaxID=672921 RepID=UPI003DA45AF1